MQQYLTMLNDILSNGEERTDRTGIGTKGIFGYQMSFNLSDGFPIVTTKKVPFKSVISELLWFIEGSGNERRLAEIHYGKPRDELSEKTTIWTANANAEYWKELVYWGRGTGEPGDLGRVYGTQWRDWKTSKNLSVDQLSDLLHGLKTDPYGRRHILTSWNPGDLPDMALPPCHCLVQFHVSSTGKLNCQLYQRSADAFLGVPFNISSYALLTHLIAQECRLVPGKFVHTLGDLHIYTTHMKQVELQLDRTPLPLPTLELNPEINTVTAFKMSDISLKNYQFHPAITAEMAV